MERLGKAARKGEYGGLYNPMQPHWADAARLKKAVRRETSIPIQNPSPLRTKKYFAWASKRPVA